jgi:type I site-specific restriction endonuclease
MAPQKKRAVTDEHKAAMAQGRTQSRSIASYLEALETHKPKRGRKRTAESVDRRLAVIDKELQTANAIKRLSLIQERLDLLNERETMAGAVDISAFEDGFVGAAKEYGQRKGISYAAWRELGVPPSVLKRAGITRAG